jgi:hypothetical protein
MKTLISIAITVLVLVASALTQTAPALKLGDAYGVAAIRFVNAWMEDQDKAYPTLKELEAQISSDSEQASYDGIATKIVKADRDKNYAINSDPKSTQADIAAYYASRQPCYADLKTNLKHRDGAIPATCKP